MHPAWTFSNPPQINHYFAEDDKFIWCDSRRGAQYTAITGWFAPDCHYTHLAAGRYKVLSLTHEEFGTTRVIFVHCRSAEGEIWLPLPSHKWA